MAGRRESDFVTGKKVVRVATVCLVFGVALIAGSMIAAAAENWSARSADGGHEGVQEQAATMQHEDRL